MTTDSGFPLSRREARLRGAMEPAGQEAPPVAAAQGEIRQEAIAQPMTPDQPLPAPQATAPQAITPEYGAAVMPPTSPAEIPAPRAAVPDQPLSQAVPSQSQTAAAPAPDSLPPVVAPPVVAPSVVAPPTGVVAPSLARPQESAAVPARASVLGGSGRRIEPLTPTAATAPGVASAPDSAPAPEGVPASTPAAVEPASNMPPTIAPQGTAPVLPKPANSSPITAAAPSWDAVIAGEVELEGDPVSFPQAPLGGWDATPEPVLVAAAVAAPQSFPGAPGTAPVPTPQTSGLAAGPQPEPGDAPSEDPEPSPDDDATAVFAAGAWEGGAPGAAATTAAAASVAASSSDGVAPAFGGSGFGAGGGNGQVPPSSGKPKKRRTVGTVIWSIIGVIAELLVTVGLILLLFVGWQLWWTDIVGNQEQAQAIEQLAATPDWTVVKPADGMADFPVGTKHTEDAPVLAEPPTTGTVFATMYVPRWGDDWRKPIAEGTDRATVLDTLGIGHYKDTAMPGQTGNFALAGHRQTHGKPFYAVDQLENGDKLIVETADAYYVYSVFEHQIVDPSTGGWVIGPDPFGTGKDPKLITLTTCHPINSTAQRYITWGEFEYWTPKSEGIPPDLPQASAKLAAQQVATPSATGGN